MFVPQPSSYCLFVSQSWRPDLFWRPGGVQPVVRSCRLVPGHPPEAQQENVSRLQRRALLLQSRLELVDPNRLSRLLVHAFTRELTMSRDVEKNKPAHDPPTRPVIHAVVGSLGAP
jgi:hypothetical protein